MKSMVFAAFLTFATAVPLWAQQAKRSPVDESSIAFQDISVIPMDTERMLPHQTVLVRDGKIAEVGPAKTVRLPLGAMRIDGRGKFLLPGLADMHTHVDRAEMLPLFLAAGVTTVLNMGLASPQFITQTRDDIVKGKIAGPRIFAAFMIDGPGDPGPEYVPLCARDARAAVDRAKLEGYDFIKAYQRLEPEMYSAVLDQAKKQHIAVVGHIPTAVGLEQTLAQGQVMIAHGEEYYKTYFHDAPEDARIAPAVELTRHAGAYVTPNLSFFATLTRTVSDPESWDRRLAAPDMAVLPPDLRGKWLGARPSKASDRFVPELAMLKKLTLAMQNAGVPLLAGTDTPANLIPGSSLVDEIELLVGAGLTPFQAISTSTRVPGQFIHQYVPGSEDFGTIAAGKSADLIVLAANPLLDARNLRRPLGVMTRGQWREDRELQSLAQKPVAGYARIAALEAAFQSTLEKNTATNAIREFQSQANPGDRLPEAFVNAVGYDMVNAHRLETAIQVFAFNAEQYPESWNAYDSLAEVYANGGQSDLAILNYRQSLALNPKNTAAAAFLVKAVGMTPLPIR